MAWLAAMPSSLAADSASTDSPSASGAPHTPVGLEGRLETNLPGTLLVPRPVDPKAPVLVRVADSRPHGTLIAYDLRYIGLEAGTYDLRPYLVRADGSATNDLPPLPVKFLSVLPPKHDGLLLPTAASPWKRLGGYHVVAVMATTLWVLLLVPILLRPRPAEGPVAEVPPPPPTLADRLRPLLDRAAAGTLDVDGKAQVERLLLGHWRQRLALDDAPMAEALVRLRAHPEAGVVLRALEEWLHRRPSGVRPDLEPLLKRYSEK